MRVILIGKADNDPGSFGGTKSRAAYGMFQTINFDTQGKGDSESSCPGLTGYEDTVLHELNHARENFGRYQTNGQSEGLDNLLLPALLQNSLPYKYNSK